MTKEPKRRPVSNEQFYEAYGNPNADMGDLTPAQQYNRKIIKNITSQYLGIVPEEDLKACGLTAMWRCLGYHKDEREGQKSQKFTTSLYRFVRWECNREVAKHNKKKKRPKVVSLSDLQTNNLPAKLPTEETTHIHECIDMLSPADKELINEYYIDKRTMHEIGNRHQYSKETARQKIAKAMESLRKLYIGGN